MTGVLRIATANDAADVQAIYAPVVRDTAISFELQPPSVDEMRTRIRTTLDAGLPWIVCEHDGTVTGYVYAARHRGDRPAYQWSVEVSVYVHEAARGSGLGRRMYTSLFDVLAFQHVQNAYAGATLPNEASVRLHDAVGFERVGIYERVGFKLGRWHDTIWWVKRLGSHPVPAPPIIPLADAARMEGFPLR
jgi:L-amino acid N-acyltransferase YncA